MDPEWRCSSYWRWDIPSGYVSLSEGSSSFFDAWCLLINESPLRMIVEGFVVTLRYIKLICEEPLPPEQNMSVSRITPPSLRTTQNLAKSYVAMGHNLEIIHFEDESFWHRHCDIVSLFIAWDPSSFVELGYNAAKSQNLCSKEPKVLGHQRNEHSDNMIENSSFSGLIWSRYIPGKNFPFPGRYLIRIEFRVSSFGSSWRIPSLKNYVFF